MSKSLNSPKIFISYSWNPIINKEKTLDLAERLISNGIDVIIDEWSLSEGQDKYSFMEKMVNETDINKVLLICNKDYVEKANKKSGGVGVESLIVSDEIYNETNQTKFVPVVFERDEKGNAYLPTFIKNRIYIDLSNESYYEEQFEKLIRNIFDRPSRRKPPLGVAPKYIIEDDPVFLRTSHKVKSIENALVNEKKNSQVFIDDYYDTFLLSLNDFIISNSDFISTTFIDDVIINKIEELKYLRDDFISFLEVSLRYSVDFDVDSLLSFLERLISFENEVEEKIKIENEFYQYATDNFKFFFYELFLYLTVIMIEYRKFKELGNILKSSIMITKEHYSEPKIIVFTFFNKYIESLNEYRNNRLEMRRYSVQADLIKQRADNKKYSFDKIKEAEVILYFVSLINNIENNKDSFYFKKWYPRTAIYRTYNLPLLDKLISKRHFEKIKHLFLVSNLDEFEQKIAKVNNSNLDNLSRFDLEFPYFKNTFNLDEVCKYD